MIKKVTVEELYASPGFEDMIAEYAKLAIKKLPAPRFARKITCHWKLLACFTAWVYMYGGLAAGFASCLISSIPHYGIRIAIAESLFAREGVRGKGIGLQLIAAVERHAASQGAMAVFMSCPIGSEFERVQLAHRNYSAETTTFVKVLT